MKSDTLETTEAIGVYRDSEYFSLVQGGPTYQFFRRAHLSGDALEWTRRRVLVLALAGWLPLLALSLIEGRAWGSAIKLPFLFDIDAHVRFLVALPLLIIADLVVHERMGKAVMLFLERKLVPDTARERFQAAMASAMHVRNSPFVEILLIALVYAVGLIIWRHFGVSATSTWYAISVDGNLQPSLAGWWMVFVSLPLFQFILLRWYFRLFIWARFLWRVSRIDLNLIPTHPDRACGLGFLSGLSQAFAPILLAHGAVYAGVVANAIFFSGMSLLQYKGELAALLGLILFLVVGPLLVFVPSLSRARRAGLREYGTFAQRYVAEFDRKWLHAPSPPDGTLVGSPDIQSLASLDSSFTAIRSTRVVPITKQAMVQLTALVLMPITPLILTMIPLEELLGKLFKMLF